MSQAPVQPIRPIWGAQQVFIPSYSSYMMDLIARYDRLDQPKREVNQRNAIKRNHQYALEQQQIPVTFVLPFFGADSHGMSGRSRRRNTDESPPASSALHAAAASAL